MSSKGKVVAIVQARLGSSRLPLKSLLCLRDVPVIDWVTRRLGACARLDSIMVAVPDTPLDASKNYMDLKHAASTALPEGVHFTLIEAVADHVIETLFLQDPRIRRLKVKIIKLAISENGEAIGVTMKRHRT